MRVCLSALICVFFLRACVCWLETQTSTLYNDDDDNHNVVKAFSPCPPSVECMCARVVCLFFLDVSFAHLQVSFAP